MGYSMRSFFIFTSFIFAGTFLLQAEENKAVLLKTHKHRKAKFSLSYPSDWSEKADADGIAFEVRAFFPGNNGLAEDPVTGSLNAALAQWLIGASLAPSQYVASQGTALGRAGRVHVQREGADVWIGGAVCPVVRPAESRIETIQP